MLSPALAPLLVLLKFTGEGEIFFTQLRVGKGGKLFYLYKFATMLRDSPNMGSGTVTLKDDPRVLPFGRVLRKTKINELPQLLNILKGDMSFIGPRPQTQRCFDAFPNSVKSEVIKVRPGLSGIGSILFRDEEIMMDANDDPENFYNDVVMPYKGALEQWYVACESIRSYFFLIGLTVWVVLGRNPEIVWEFFDDLPPPPEELAKWI